MASIGSSSIGRSGAALGVAAVLVSVVGLQLGWLATELVGNGGALAAGLVGLCVLTGVLGFWLGAEGRLGFDRP